MELKFVRLPVGAYEGNCYFIWDEETKQGFVVDPGAAEYKIVDFIHEKHLKIDKILLTHGHSDHIAGVDMLREATGAKVYIHRLDANYMTEADKNLSKMTGQALVLKPADVLLEDGDEIEALEGLTLKVLHTPGHTPGSICFVGDGFILSGDTLFKGSIGRTDFPGGSYEDMLKSIEKLKRCPDTLLVLPGHFDTSTMAFEKKNNPYF